MSILLNSFPTKINGCAIHTDFRVMIQYQKLIKNDNLSEEQKINIALNRFYIEKPDNMEKAIKGLNWFYQCGRTEKTSKGNGRNVIAYDFTQDDYMIYSAFYQSYYIDLENTYMHWWKFSSLLLSLPKDTLFMEIVGYRVADTSDMPKKMKAFYDKQKKLYAVNKNHKRKYMTLEERDAAFQAEMDKKFQRAMLRNKKERN